MKTSKILLLNAVTLATLTLCGTASGNETDKEGYLLDNRGVLVRSGSGSCIHTGFWTLAMAIAECDATLEKKVLPRLVDSPPPVVASLPAVASLPIAPLPVANKQLVYTPYTLQTETLFAYNKSDLGTDGKQQINDGIVGMMKKYPKDGAVLITGHADRIGSDEYNMALSQRRADAVKAYLIEQGIDDKRIETAAKGKSQPIVSCDKVKGKANRKNEALITCLQPNRRIVLNLNGQSLVQP
jgi:OmpA-OmpF porin, OOP family